MYYLILDPTSYEPTIYTYDTLVLATEKYKYYFPNNPKIILLKQLEVVHTITVKLKDK